MSHAITPTAGMGTRAAPARQIAAPVLREELSRLAFAVADGAVRSDIECYAHGFMDGLGRPCYDLSKPSDFAGPAKEDHAHALQVVICAAVYIELRGDVWPWLLVRDPTRSNIVRFEAKL